MRLFLTVFVFFFVFDLWAESDHLKEHLLEQAESAYKQGDYKEALSLWDSLLRRGYVSKALLYDMGLAAYHLDCFSLSLAYARRAFYADPLFWEAEELARLARERLDRSSPPEAFFLSRWWHIFYTRLSAKAWSLLALVFFWLVGSYLLFWHRSRTKLVLEPRRLVFVALFLFLGLLSLAAAYSRSGQFRQPEVLVSLKQQSLHVGADADSPVLEELPEGVELRYLDQIGHWYKVETPEGQTGWLLARDVNPSFGVRCAPN